MKDEIEPEPLRPQGQTGHNKKGEKSCWVGTQLSSFYRKDVQ